MYTHFCTTNMYVYTTLLYKNNVYDVYFFSTSNVHFYVSCFYNKYVRFRALLLLYNKSNVYTLTLSGTVLTVLQYRLSDRKMIKP